jgi:hypothetical protein
MGYVAGFKGTSAEAGGADVASETRLNVWTQLGPEMLRVVSGSELPGDLAVACCGGRFLLFVSADALRFRSLNELAHEAAHMLQGACSCGCFCRGYTARIKLWLLVASSPKYACSSS